ncbi:Maf family protein [Streptococcus entericus]|uniref:Maf family protein n=1 Tax=Streptococcus entericus TaxID=155680 RepID=UPI00038109CB|nr:Maf family protein [Streptococcus entericus]
MKTVIDYEKYGELTAFSQVVLLSNSPRRRDLLSFLNPEIAGVEVDERAIEDHYMAVYAKEDFLTRAAKTCCEISKAKSDKLLEDGKLYISADTIVLSDDKIFNKPKDLSEAETMLRSYFGKSHYVVTSVCLRTTTYLDVFYAVARLDFVDYYDGLDEAVQSYVRDKRPLDKSGAYGIQELDPRFVKEIHGNLYTVIGLPVAEVSARLFAPKTP